MNEFQINIDSISSSNRKNGVSGMMRVKNDAEFIEQCVESCLPALDELVIVYNDCTDNSPQIIESLSKKYPEKIKSYHYKPKIYAWNLTPENIEAIFNGEIPAENTLAGYYNYALSKTTYKYVMKIDADQFYYTEYLKVICNCYRINSTKHYLSIFKKLYLYYISLFLSLSVRLKIYFSFIIKKDVYNLYIKILKEYITVFKPDTSLSGLNVFHKEKRLYTTLGLKINNGVNILPPYNGEGDHPIFRVTKETYYIPIIDEVYNNLNHKNNSVIEHLRGLRKLWIIGPMWIHLNSCRKSVYEKNLQNFENFPEAFVTIDKFYLSKFKSFWNKIDSSLYNKRKKLIFSFIHTGVSDEFISYFNRLSDSIKLSYNQLRD